MFGFLFILPIISFLPLLLVAYLITKIVNPLVTCAVLCLTVFWAVGYRKEQKYRSRSLPELEELLASLKSKPAKSDEKLRKLARWLNIPSPVGIYDEDTIRAVKELLASASGRKAEAQVVHPATPTSSRSSVADVDMSTPSTNITTEQLLKDIQTKALLHELALRTIGPTHTRRITCVKNRREMLEYVIAEKKQALHPHSPSHSHCQHSLKTPGGWECTHGRSTNTISSIHMDDKKDLDMKENTHVHFNSNSNTNGGWDRV